MVSMRPYTKAWLIWGGVTLGSFAVIEGLALASGDMANTLTAHLQLVRPAVPSGRLLRGIDYVEGHAALQPRSHP
jgi:hypothetical protein